MKTVLFKEDDGHKIIIGFDNAIIDPVATEKIVATENEKLPEFKAFMASKKLFMLNEQDLIKSAKKGDKVKLEQLKLKQKQLKDALKEKTQEFAVKSQEIYQNKKVPFKDKKNEKNISDEKYEELLTHVKGCAAGEAISIDEKLKPVKIKSLKGKKYFMLNAGKYIEHEIEKAGDDYPLKAIIELDDEQQAVYSGQLRKIQNDENGGLTKNADINYLLTLASSNRLSYEMSGDSPAEALKKATDWYNDELVKINEIYD